MNEQWIEMNDIRMQSFDRAVWVPLKCAKPFNVRGAKFRDGHSEEYLGVQTVAVFNEYRGDVEDLHWGAISHGGGNYGHVEDDEYFASTDFVHKNKRVGENLILVSCFDDGDPAEWIPNPDLVLSLRLKREGDIWVAPNEGYIDVIKAIKDDDGNPIELIIRADHLKDYLAARNMGLWVTRFQLRSYTSKAEPKFEWGSENKVIGPLSDRWECRLRKIHEGGHPFGEKIHLVIAGRTDVDTRGDIPEMYGIPSDDSIEIETREISHSSPPVYNASGEYFRDYWISGGEKSVRVRKDKEDSGYSFITDELGKRESSEELKQASKWLWFRPGLVQDLQGIRNFGMKWYSKFTFSIHLGNGIDIYLGVNGSGLINAYAKDVATLPRWLQSHWVGFNANPESGVCSEMLAAQVSARPADTQAPESFFEIGLLRLRDASLTELGTCIYSIHPEIESILPRIHRFRVLSDSDLFALAKDITRVAIDDLNVKVLSTLLPGRKDIVGKSLKLLEALISQKVGTQDGSMYMSPLFAIYDLRLADAHLPSSSVTARFSDLHIEETSCLIEKGRQMLESCTSSLFAIADILKKQSHE